MDGGEASLRIGMLDLAGMAPHRFEERNEACPPHIGALAAAHQNVMSQPVDAGEDALFTINRGRRWRPFFPQRLQRGRARRHESQSVDPSHFLHRREAICGSLMHTTTLSLAVQ